MSKLKFPLNMWHKRAIVASICLIGETILFLIDLPCINKLALLFIVLWLAWLTYCIKRIITG